MTKPTIIDDRYASAEERFQSYLELFLCMKKQMIPEQYLDHFCISEPQLTQVVGMYLIDRARLKKENGIERLHRSKVAAYLIKWVLCYRPIYTTVNINTWEEMDQELQTIVLDINYIYAFYIIFQTLDEFLPQDFYPDGKFARITDDLLISMRMGMFSEQTSAILFDALAAHYVDHDNKLDAYTC